jgi:hypothetical protein
MTSHSSPSHRSSGESGVASSPDPVVALPLRRGSSRPLMIRRSWVRARDTSTDPKVVESGFLTVRASHSLDRQAA